MFCKTKLNSDIVVVSVLDSSAELDEQVDCGIKCEGGYVEVSMKDENVGFFTVGKTDCTVGSFLLLPECTDLMAVNLVH